MMTLDRLFAIFTAALLALAAGCGTTTAFNYPPSRPETVRIAESPVYPQKVAVLPFIDCRTGDNCSETMFLGLIPTFPFGYSEYRRPETGRNMIAGGDRFQFDAANDPGRALTLSLQRSGLFRQVAYADRAPEDADYILEGRLLSTYYKGRSFTYCISLAGPVLWFLGAPSGTCLNRFEATLSLKTRDGHTLWQYAAGRDDYVVQWIYTGSGCNFSLYPELTVQVFNDALLDLAALLKTAPKLR